jgi:hypothetical protein
VRQCEFSIPAKTVAVSAAPHIEAAPYNIRKRRFRRFYPTCRLPKLPKETSNVLQTSQTLPAHPLPMARRHVGHIAGHHRRLNDCDARTTPRLRDVKLISFIVGRHSVRRAPIAPRTGRRPYFCVAKPVRNGAHRAAVGTGRFRLAIMSETIGMVLQAIGYGLDGRGGELSNRFATESSDHSASMN